MYGIDQTVWTDGKGNYYLWDKYQNDYVIIPYGNTTNYKSS